MKIAVAVRFVQHECVPLLYSFVLLYAYNGNTRQTSVFPKAMQALCHLSNRLELV